MAEDHKDGDAAPAKKKSKLPLIIGALVLLIAIGGGAYYFLVMKPAAEAKAAEDAAAEEDSGTAKGDKAKGDKADKTDSKKKKKKKKKTDKAEPPAYLTLDAFTVNLADVEQEHYLQATIVLQVGGESAVEELKKQNPMIRDTVLKLLSGSKAGDLRSVEGKQKLAADIIEQVAAAAEESGVEVPEIDRVFFTAFIIQ
jgi:flagellar FliL protein